METVLLRCDLLTPAAMEEVMETGMEPREAETGEATRELEGRGLRDVEPVEVCEGPG